jgi:hypothetical protein
VFSEGRKNRKVKAEAEASISDKKHNTSIFLFLCNEFFKNGA